ncbi:hypothetical protein GR215_23245 [Rhizobium leguminosarum]|uniref:hypothetical protein n=1 Tax=Rhizobium leguminosarum TaxID=384 RepID=UPI0013B729CF|nr:hypothetical protein [Rhizobium leguminosarum]NEH44765.1 hypothetical protein [Rhizobium leguminosarum]
MRQTELTPVQKATARRLSAPAKSAVKGLILAEREQYGGLTDAPRLLDAAAAMFESNVNASTIFNMVRHTAHAFTLSIEKDKSRKRRGRPSKQRWTVEQDEALLRYYDDAGTLESAVADFNSDFREAVFTMSVGKSSLADEHQLVKNWKNADRRNKRLERFQQSINEVIRQRLMRLMKQREDARILSDFEEQE